MTHYHWTFKGNSVIGRDHSLKGMWDFKVQVWGPQGGIFVFLVSGAKTSSALNGDFVLKRIRDTWVGVFSKILGEKQKGKKTPP